MEKWLHDLLNEGGVRLSGCYHCGHHTQGSLTRYSKACDCRKSAPELILRASLGQEFALTRSWIVGHRIKDLGTGHRGCPTSLLKNANEAERTHGIRSMAQFGVADLAEVKEIYAADKSS
jgi:histidinol phosphatase-like enzyme